MIERAFGRRVGIWQQRIVDEVINLFAERGASAYLGEPVTQLEHALQAAHLAEAEGASRSLVAAALLHDIGHLLRKPQPHQDAGWRWLAERFLPVLGEAARLHVEAKRYLCAIEPGYHGTLSAASVASLVMQGGPYTPAEAREFEQEPFYLDAVRVRRWDDAAKQLGLLTPALPHYRCLLEVCCL